MSVINSSLTEFAGSVSLLTSRLNDIDAALSRRQNELDLVVQSFASSMEPSMMALTSLLSEVLSQEHLGCLLLGRGFKCLLNNDQALKLFGGSVDIFGERRHDEVKFLVPDSNLEFERDQLPWVGAVRTRALVSADIFVERQGQVKALRVGCLPIVAPEQTEIAALFLFVVDMTERRAVEHEAKTAHAAMVAKLAELNDTRAALELAVSRLDNSSLSLIRNASNATPFFKRLSEIANPEAKTPAAAGTAPATSTTTATVPATTSGTAASATTTASTGSTSASASKAGTTQTTPPETEPDTTAAPASGTKGKPENQDPLVLIVDDMSVNRRLLKHQLQRLNIKSRTVSSGAEALEELQLRKFDCILLDLEMPVMDGFATAKSIREQQAHSIDRLTIVALSAYASASEKERCLEAGIDDYLVNGSTEQDIHKTLGKYIHITPPSELPDSGNPVLLAQALETRTDEAASASVGAKPKSTE